MPQPVRAGSGGVGSGAFRGNDIGMVARAAAQMERRLASFVSDTINVLGG